jgi:tetratricopeptide (TPR) repeat protein
LETKTAEILIGLPLQCQRLLEWFQPIEYRAVTENSGNDLVAFKNMAAYYDRLRQKRFDLSQPISSLEKDSTYNLVSEAFDTEEEASSRPVYNDMINSANLMSSPDTDSLGISPVLYPRNKLMVQKAGEGALERRIAAWLYIKGRIAKEQIIENENLLSVFTNLGFLIIRGLITSEKRGDTSLFKVIIKENRKLKSAKKSITIKDALEEAKRLKEEAKTYLALARKFKDESLFKDALDVLEDARTLLKKELENPWGAVETNRLLQERVMQVAAEMADCFGIAGGEYRKRKNLPGAIDMYDQGCEYEENPVYAIQNSYNIVNSIVLRITGNLASLESLDTRIKSAIGVVRKQIDTSRERDWWAWADLGLLYVLSQAQDLAIECYRKIRDLGAKEEHLSSISDVLKQLQGQIKESYPDIAEFIQQCIDLLKR